MDAEYASDWTDTGVLRVVKAHRKTERRCVDNVLANVFGPDTDSAKDSCNGEGTCDTLTRID